MSTVRRILLVLLVLVAATGSLSCGTSTNNDQGTSFLALGFFIDSDGDVGDLGTWVVLNVDSVTALPQINPLQVPNTLDDDGSIQGGFIGLENRMTSQYIRTIGADCSYFVSGADPSLQIPSDSTYFTTVLPAVTVSDDGTTEASTAYAQMSIVSSDVITFLSVNQNLLPELPFRMIAECIVTGVTQGGDVLETNPVNYTMTFYDLPECCTGVSDPNGAPGFQVGTGSGGTFTGGTDTTTDSDADAE